MRLRTILPLVLVAVAAACGTATESPVAPPDLAFVLDGSDPPPPPLDTQMVEVDGGSGGFSFDGFSARYFANRQGTNMWIAFESGDGVDASPDARLQYNQKTGRTSGHGRLVAGDGSVLELRTVNITAGSFGACDGSVKPPVIVDRVELGRTTCGAATFTVAGGGSGFLVVSKRTAIEDVVD